MKKKIISIISMGLVTAACLSISGCSNKKIDEDSAETTTVISQTTRQTVESTKQPTTEPTTEAKPDYSEVLADLPDSFVFSSGVGAWQTDISINPDGTFEGIFSDSDMGDIGEGYPNGTVYMCEFNGKFTSPKKVSEYVYSMEIEDIKFKRTPNENEIIDGIKYIYSTARGLEGAGEMLLYLPGCPKSEMAEGFVRWASMLYGLREMGNSLPEGYYGLYNVTAETGFVGDKNQE